MLPGEPDPGRDGHGSRVRLESTSMPSDDEFDDWDDLDDPSDPPWADDEDGDSSDTLPCPVCGEPVFEDSPRCPSCGQYITPGGTGVAARPAWILITALVCLALALWWVFGGLG